jgi:hypothetical protein
MSEETHCKQYIDGSYTLEQIDWISTWDHWFANENDAGKTYLSAKHPSSLVTLRCLSPIDNPFPLGAFFASFRSRLAK